MLLSLGLQFFRTPQYFCLSPPCATTDSCFYAAGWETTPSFFSLRVSWILKFEHEICSEWQPPGCSPWASGCTTRQSWGLFSFWAERHLWSTLNEGQPPPRPAPRAPPTLGTPAAHPLLRLPNIHQVFPLLWFSQFLFTYATQHNTMHHNATQQYTTQHDTTTQHNTKHNHVPPCIMLHFLNAQ